MEASPTSALRNELMEHYLPLVRKSAERLHAKLPNSVQLDDLVSAGVLGLMKTVSMRWFKSTPIGMTGGPGGMS